MFTFTTKKFKEDAIEFSKHNFEKNYKKSMGIIFAGAALTLALSILLIALKESLWISISLLVLTLALLAYGFLFYRALTKGVSDVAIEQVDEVITTFNKTDFEVITKYKDKGQASSKQEYAQIEKIEETDKYFYLYLTKVSAFSIRKDSIEKGTVSDFRKFLRKEKNFEIILKEEKKTTKNRQRRRMEAKKEK